MYITTLNAKCSFDASMGAHISICVPGCMDGSFFYVIIKMITLHPAIIFLAIIFLLSLVKINSQLSPVQGSCANIFL